MEFPNKIIKKGSTDILAIQAIKTRLNTILGTKLDPNNGNFGEDTEELVKQFQKTRNLLADGVVGSLTWNALFSASPLPSPIISNKLSERAIEIAKTQLNVREKTGKNDGEAVESYLRSVGLGKGYSWCAAFVYWCFNQASKDLGIKNPLAQTAGVLDHWTKAKNNRTSSPQSGDIFIMDFGGGHGHTGIVMRAEGDYVITIEGNTAADPTYASQDREGDGVYIRKRKISSIKGFIRY